MFHKKSNNSWLWMGSAIVGGFLLGLTYTKYGDDIKGSIQRFNNRRDVDFDVGFTPDDESAI